MLATIIGLQVFEITESERDLGLVGLAQFLQAARLYIRGVPLWS